MSWRKSGTKFGNIKLQVAGEWFDSKLEAAVYQMLLLRIASGEFTEIRRQFTVELIPGIRWRADFQCIKPDGSFILVEAKGYPSEVWALKLKLIKHIRKYHVEIWVGTHTKPFLSEIIRAE